MATESGIRLTWKEQNRLRQLLRRDNEGATAMRSTAVLLSGSGMSCEEVGKILGVTAREVRSCRQRWRERGLDGMHDNPKSGRPPLADAKYIRLLLRTAKRNPHKMGYAFSRWTTPRLSTYLARKTGTKLSPHYISELLQMHEYRWGKSKLTTRNLADPKEKKTCSEMAQEAAKGFEILAIQF